MERFFAALSKRQTMMLLTAVTFGGAEAEGAFEHLPPDEAELLKHRANEMLQIPREKRIPLLAQEIKRLVTGRRGALWSADPQALASALRNERGALIEVVLRALPANVGEQVRSQLFDRDPVALTREVKPEVLAIVRWKLEELLGRTKGAFKFSDVLILQSRELLSVCDRMGARALATAIAGLSEVDREAFLKALPPDQRNLGVRAADAGVPRKLSEADARVSLELHDALKNPSAGMRSAGAQRLARACLAQSPELAARVIERHPGDFGRLLQKWIKEERNRPLGRGDGGRADIVEQMERLAQKGIIDRPIRLPPPPKRPLGPATVKPAGMPGGKLLPPPARPPGGPPPRIPPLVPGLPQRKPLLAPPAPRTSARPAAEPPARRDFMAERAARNAGLISARPPPDAAPRRPGLDRPDEPRRPGHDRPDEARHPAGPRVTRPPVGEVRRGPPRDPQAATTEPLRERPLGGRVLRAGEARPGSKPDGEKGGGRAITSPTLQNLPRLKKAPPSEGGTHAGRPPRRGTGARGVLKGPDRGPKGGSG